MCRPLRLIIVRVDEFERVVPVQAGCVIRVGQVFEIDIYGARPVFGSLGELEIDIPPGIQFDAFDGPIEMLQFNSAFVFVDGDDFKQVAVKSAIPAANFRDSYPMISGPAIRVKRSDEKTSCELLYKRFSSAFVSLNASIHLLPDVVAEALAAQFEFRYRSFDPAVAGRFEFRESIYCCFNMFRVVHPVGRNMEGSAADNFSSQQRDELRLHDATFVMSLLRPWIREE